MTQVASFVVPKNVHLKALLYIINQFMWKYKWINGIQKKKWSKQNQKLTWVHREQLNEEKGRETKEKLILKKKKMSET